MMLKTRARRIHTLARADGEQFFEEAKRFVHGTRTRIRAEVPPAVFHHAPCDMDTRICFRQRHLDVRIRLIIFQADIVSGSMPFDQIALSKISASISEVVIIYSNVAIFSTIARTLGE